MPLFRLPRWLTRPFLRAPYLSVALQPTGRREEGYCYLGDNRALARTHRGHGIYLDTRDHSLAPHIARSGVWEWDVERVASRLARPGQSVVEVGANVGYHTLVMAQAIGPLGRLRAFEAHPRLAALLRGTLELNGFQDRVAVHACAAMDMAGEIEFALDPDYLGSGHWALPGGLARYSQQFTVPATTLDAACGEDPPLDLLRMDAEGSEPQVLRGASALLARSPAVRILCEWSPPMMRPRADLGALVAWLAEDGFLFWRIEPGARLAPVPSASLPDLPHGELVICRTVPD